LQEKDIMSTTRVVRFVLVAVWFAIGAGAYAQAPATQKPATQKPFEPSVGQEGKDVVWVPTPQALVDKMLEMAKVTPQDFLIDLGSGDGRTVITAAKRGTRAMGVEYNPDMVELSTRNAAAAGVSDKAKFVKADLFETDLSQATVITMFLLPTINMKLRPAILNLKPGTRIVSNTFTMEDWQADETATITDAGCSSWCTALLWIVPAKVEGSWHLPQGDLKLTQQFQMISGTLGSTPISEGKVRGREVTFTAGGVKYTGHIDGNVMTGSATGGNGNSWTATRK
jgi:precorrin-6B methylase 2